MIDLKIKQLFSEIKTDDQANQILKSNCTIYEKIDGTKLTLYRNNEPYNKLDYTKNWIVSYKSNIIYKEDFDGFKDQFHIISQVKHESIGISQYFFVHKYLEEHIHPNAFDLECNTELFVEFNQRKPTLTRDYTSYHYLYLIGTSEADLKVHIQNGRYFSMGHSEFSDEIIYHLSRTLHIAMPPKLFSGRLDRLNEAGQFKGLIALKTISDKFLQNQSVLGGKMEGIVFQFQNGEIYKHTQSDQYDKKIRSIKKNRYKANTEEDEQKYWNSLISLSELIVERLPVNDSSLSKLSKLSVLCYNTQFKKLTLLNTNKTNLNISDDLFLTSKTLLINKIIFNGAGLYVLAGKPVHLGHWKTIQKISSENQNVTLFISTGNRDNISGKAMFDIWLQYFIPNFPMKINCVFSDSPMQELMHQINFCESHRTLLYSDIKIYSDDVDILTLKENDKINKSFVKFCPIPRKDTIDISGTLMRQFLSSDLKDTFLKYLPPFDQKIKDDIYKRLKT